MKKIIFIVVTISLVLALFTACGSMNKPQNGTYKSSGMISQTWTFSGSNKITLSTAGGLISSSGTYTISGDTLSVTSNLFGTETTSTYTITEITSKSFFIDGEKFVKQ